ILALVRLGDVTLALNSPERALNWSRKLHDSDPQWVSAYLVSAEALLRLGQPEAAREELMAGASRQPGNPDVLMKLSDLLISQRKFAQAPKALSSARPRDGRESSQLHRLVAATLKAEGRGPEALEEMEAAHDADPEDLHLLLQLAQMLAESERYTQALAMLKGVSRAPDEFQKTIDEQISELEARQKSERARLFLENPRSERN